MSCDTCRALTAGDVSKPHPHVFECLTCDKKDIGLCIGTCHHYLAPTIVTLPFGWYTAEDRELRETNYFCSAKCVMDYTKDA